MKESQGNNSHFHGYGQVIAQDDVLDGLTERLYSLERATTKIGTEARVSRKRRFKTKKQAAVLKHLTKAMCVETIDPWKENRVRFYHPVLHDPKTPLLKLPFAAPVSSMGGFDDCGMNWVPPAGSTLIIFFEGGSRESPYYLGTTWSRDRGPGGSQYPVPMREWEGIWSGHRHGYYHGPGPGDPNDEHQSLPPWNTENYNSLDIDQIEQFVEDPNQQRKVSPAHIYGFKTPEKHMWKAVDGNPKCNRRWKRLEMMSGCGNWMIFKDDHLHEGGQWAHPECVKSTDLNPCSIHDDDLPYFTDIIGEPIEGKSLCIPGCEGDGPKQCSRIMGGHTETPGGPFQSTPAHICKDPSEPVTTYYESQEGANESFKHMNECRPYKGPGTPQNNKCDLPQSGIQLLSISGHTFVMDDSVEEPRGKPEWERSTQTFDFGCNDKYMGVFYMKSATGHAFKMTDIEEPPKVRSCQNYMELRSANGNSIQLNDHTVRTHSSQDGCQMCPPDCAGNHRGIWITSTSRHMINMCDDLNLQCGPCRREGGIPTARAGKAYIQIRSGYGLEMRYNDDFSQEETQQQWIQILHPQCVDPETDQNCNACDDCKVCRGPHILRFQGRPKGNPGIVFLRAGGHSIRQTHDMDIVIVGDKECNPSDKFTYVSKKFITATEDIHFRYSGELHIFFAEKQILLMAGRDCPPPPGKKCRGPCLYNVIIARCPVFCPVTKILHWTEKAMSERVFASGYHPCQVPCSTEFEEEGICDKYDQDISASDGGKGCMEEEPQIVGAGPEFNEPGHPMMSPTEGVVRDPNEFPDFPPLP